MPTSEHAGRASGSWKRERSGLTHMYSIETKQTIHPDDLVKKLLNLGYEPEWSSASPGSFARRGGIVDVYPNDSKEPIRIEFDNQIIASLRTFDPKRNA